MRRFRGGFSRKEKYSAFATVRRQNEKNLSVSHPKVRIAKLQIMQHQAQHRYSSPPILAEYPLRKFWLLRELGFY